MRALHGARVSESESRLARECVCVCVSVESRVESQDQTDGRVDSGCRKEAKVDGPATLLVVLLLLPLLHPLSSACCRSKM